MPNVLITGAARGIGLATVKAFAGAGWSVIGLDREFSDFPNGKKIEYNLENLDGIPGLIESLGEIHALVNNAGIHNGLPYEQYTEEARRRVLRINLEAPAALIGAVAPQMKRRKSGRVVNLCSIAAYVPHPDLWYGISKAGVASMTRSYALYLGAHGIQVNAVAPGAVETEMLKVVDAARRETLLQQVYTGRIGKPEEIATAILWLCTASPATVNGAILDINDGTYPR